MRSSLLLLLLAVLFAHPASHAAVRTQVHQHSIVARQTAIAFHAAIPIHGFRSRATASEPQAVNAPTRTTAFMYLVNLVRGLFTRIAS